MMKKNRVKEILIIFLIAVSSLTYAQKGNAVLILKDGTRVNGIGEVSGISSIVSIKFKNDTLKYKTYRSKKIIGIDILENNYYRKFRYKYKDGEKFPEILEIVSIDSLSLYIRIYEGRVLSNSFSTEPFPIQGDESSEIVKLSNGQNITIAQNRNIYREIDFPRYSYYVGVGESDQVVHLYTKGLPFAKNFEKSMKEYFTDCPLLIEKIENNEFSNKEVWKVIELYNKKCVQRSTE